jgi:hypothetical protein
VIQKLPLLGAFLLAFLLISSCQKKTDIETKTGGHTMSGVVLAAPVLPGKVEEWREWSRELAEGTKRSEFVTFMKKCGLSRDRCWLQESPGGTLAIILYEGETPALFLQQIGASEEPFAVWFREKVMDLHGIDLAKPMEGPPPELVTDIHID